MPPSYVPPPKKGGCLPWAVLFLVVGLAGSLLMNLALISGSVKGSSKAKKPKGDLQEEWVDGEGDKKIALIEVTGVIAEDMGGGSPFSGSTRTVTYVRNRLDQAADDEDIAAVILRIESPGGTVSASDQIWKEIVDFKAATNRPVIVSMGALCASGGYYISAPADHIIAEPTTTTGSIGVIMSSFNLSGLLKRFDVEAITLKAGDHKDLLNAYEPIRESDRAILQGLIDESYERFVTLISEGRGMDLAAVKALADGRVYSANQAEANGLVDQIGYIDDAYAKARELASAPDATVIRFKRESSFFDALTGRAQGAGGGGIQIVLDPQAIRWAETPRLMYLWR
ncbi:MAG: signal peptide peptidase SppA [Planctomycetota bacterium]